MKKLIILFCSVMVVVCFSCKKTCECKKLTIDNKTGDVVNTTLEGTHSIDRGSSCDALAADLKRQNPDANPAAGMLLGFFLFAFTGNFEALNIGHQEYHTEYQCTGK